jgi:hypothetical protein
MTITPGSRYEESDRAWVSCHIYDVYENVRLEETTPPSLRFEVRNREATYRVTTLPLPPPPPAEYFVKQNEHMPLLAFKFLEDSTQWWRIAEVNVPVWYPLDLPPGSYIRIPS